MNMGAWSFMSQRLIPQINGGLNLKYAGRIESASPAVGSSHISVQDQKMLIKEAFTVK